MSKFRPKYNKSTNNGSRSPVKKKKSIPIHTNPVCWYKLADGFVAWGGSSNIFIPRGDATGENPANNFRYHNGVMLNEVKGAPFSRGAARFENVEELKKEREQKEREQKEGR